MTISFISSFAHSGNPTTAPTGTLPTTQANDIIVVAVTDGNTNTGPASLTGTSVSTGGLTWTKKADSAGNGTTMHGGLWWTRATGNHSGQTVIAATNNSGALVGAVYRGCKLSGDPFNQAAALGHAAATVTTAGFTTTVDGCMLLLALCEDDDVAMAGQSVANVGAMAERIENGSTGGNDTLASISDVLQSTAGATGNFSWTGGTLDFTVTIVAALEPEPPIPYSDASSWSEAILSDTALRAFWRLADTSGTTATNELGTNHGTYVGSPTLGEPSLLIGEPNGRSVRFNGSSQWVTVANHASLHVGDTFTLIVTASREDFDTGDVLIAKDGEWVLYVAANDRLILRKYGVGDVVESTITITDDTVHRYVVTKSGSTVKLYIDGTDVTGTVTNQTFGNGSGSIFIGTEAASSPVWAYQGKVAEVALIGRAITSTDVSDLETLALTAPSTASQWDLDGDAQDAIGSNHGTLVGSPAFGDSLVTSEPSGQSIICDGSSKYVEVPNHASLQLSSSYWLTAWIERGDTGSGYIIHKGTDDYYLYMYNGNGLEVGHRDAGGTYRFLTAATSIKQDHKVRVDGVFTGAELRLYINGILIDSTAQTNQPRVSTGELRIGSNVPTTGDNWNGRIDKVRVRNTVPTGADILAEYRDESLIIFEDDFESGISLWVPPQEVGATAEVTTATPPVVMDSGDALKCSLGTGDERAEMLMSADLHRFVEGDDIYYRFKTYLESGFPVDASAWGSLVWQTHNQGSGGGPVVALYIGGNPGEWSIEGDTNGVTAGGEVVDWDGPAITTEQVDEWVIRVLHSSNPAVGLVEVQRNGIQVASVNRKTLVNDFNYFKTGYYRDTALTGTGVLWIDGYTVARENLWLLSDPSFVDGEGSAAAVSGASGDAVRVALGTGQADVISASVGSAQRLCDGAGSATAISASLGAGEIVFDGSGSANTVTSSSGEGELVREGEGSASASSSSTGEGVAIRLGNGTASATSSATGNSSCIFNGAGSAGARSEIMVSIQPFIQGFGSANANSGAIGEGQAVRNGQGFATATGTIAGYGVRVVSASGSASSESGASGLAVRYVIGAGEGAAVSEATGSAQRIAQGAGEAHIASGASGSALLVAVGAGEASVVSTAGGSAVAIRIGAGSAHALSFAHAYGTVAGYGVGKPRGGRIAGPSSSGRVNSQTRSGRILSSRPYSV